MTNSFVGFYTSPPIWAGEAPDLKDAIIIKDLSNIMSHIEFAFNYPDFNLSVCRDGMIILDVFEMDERAQQLRKVPPEMCSWWNEYLSYLNCINLFLDNAVDLIMNHVYLDLSEITNKDIIKVTVVNNSRICQPPFPIGSAISYQIIPNTPCFLESFLSDICEAKKKNNDAINSAISAYVLNLVPDLFSHRLAIPRAVFAKVAESLSLIMKEKQMLPLIAGIAKSICEYKVANYPVSLTLAWFVIESMLQKKWSAFLEEKNKIYPDGMKRINKERRDVLNGRDYTISIITNILELANVMPIEVFAILEKVRRYRNRVVHQDHADKCTAKHCDLAIKLAVDLLSEALPIRIMPPSSYFVPCL